MARTRYTDPAPPILDEHGIPEGATLTACTNGHIAMTSLGTVKRKESCWIRDCKQQLRAVSRQTADRILDQARVAHELGRVG